MTFATLKIIHDVLTDHVDYLDEMLQDAGRDLDEACAQHEADAEQGVETAQRCIDAAMERRQAAFAELSKAQKALDEFEKQEWS